MLLGLRSMLLVLSLLSFIIGCNGQKNPNVILILTDDQGWGDLSGSGNTNLSTPHIDALASEGIKFSNFFVQPVCSPTRAEILTGRYYPRTGVYSTSAGGERIDLDETTIADVLSAQGYSTAVYGKWHNGMQPPYHPNARGFDDFYGFASGHWGNYYSPMLEHNGKIVRGEGYLPDDLTNHAISFIKENKRKPFFLYIPFNTPHSPMQVPDKYWRKQLDKELSMFNRKSEQEDTLFTKAALAMVENIDDNIGKLLTSLRKNKLEEETIVIFLSDNGPNGVRWNGGMKGRKGSTDDGGVKSPLIIRWKNHLPAGVINQDLTGSVDIFPTILGLCGIEYEENKSIDGLNFLKEDYTSENRYIYNYWNGNLSVRTQNFRLDKNDALYEMNSDPGQFVDVRYDFPSQYERLMEAKKIWRKEVISELSKVDERPFPVGHPDHDFTQLPARDADFTEGIIRSNKWPNSSHLKQWYNAEDSIFWDVDVLKEGKYKVEVYHTCPPESVGAEIVLKSSSSSTSGTITESYDPPEIGMAKDVVPRGEGPEKHFNALSLGTVSLVKGPQVLSLKLEKQIQEPGVEFRLMMLNRVGN